MAVTTELYINHALISIYHEWSVNLLIQGCLKQISKRIERPPCIHEWNALVETANGLVVREQAMAQVQVLRYDWTLLRSEPLRKRS